MQRVGELTSRADVVLTIGHDADLPKLPRMICSRHQQQLTVQKRQQIVGQVNDLNENHYDRAHKNFAGVFEQELQRSAGADAADEFK